MTDLNKKHSAEQLDKLFGLKIDIESVSKFTKLLGKTPPPKYEVIISITDDIAEFLKDDKKIFSVTLSARSPYNKFLAQMITRL